MNLRRRALVGGAYARLKSRNRCWPAQIEVGAPVFIRLIPTSSMWLTENGHCGKANGRSRPS
jgi:hypothetical protein